jgi:hypothetical protein
MDKSARKLFNDSFTKEKYENMVLEIQSEFPETLDFRVAESPIFISKELKSKLLIAANDIIDTIKRPDFKTKTENAIPTEYYFNNESEHPDFIAIDFAICKSKEGDLEPQLIELQGFPSLFAYQNYLSGKYKKHFTVDANFSPYFNKLNAFSYINEMEKVLKPIAKNNTILLEVYPEKQKTRIDFEISKTYWRIETVCLSQIYLKDKTLYYKNGDDETRIDNIYNRIIFDEIDRKYPELKSQINYIKIADVKWITHPNWFYRISKFCMPLLKGKYIPESNYLNTFTEYPEDLDQYVLKPLFSFAGSGVDMHPTSESLDKIEDKENFILQRKVQYEPVVEDINGVKIKVEIRLLYVWPEGKAHPKLLINLARLSRGEMIGVDFNKNVDWVGGSCAFIETI